MEKNKDLLSYICQKMVFLQKKTHPVNLPILRTVCPNNDVKKIEKKATNPILRYGELTIGTSPHSPLPPQLFFFFSVTQRRYNLNKLFTFAQHFSDPQ